MKMRCLLLLGLSIPAMALADATNLPVQIGAAAAAAHYNQMLTVTGVVAQVTYRPTIVFINLDHPYPDSPLAVIIHSRATNQFGNLRALQGQSVAVTGKVVNYHGRPEVTLEKADQLLVLTNRIVVPSVPVVPAAPATGNGTNDLTKGIL